MVENLPSDSASALRERGHDWTRMTHLMADIADAVRYLYALTANVYGVRVSAPDPIDRPGDAERRAAEAAERHRSHDEISSQLLPGR